MEPVINNFSKLEKTKLNEELQIGESPKTPIILVDSCVLLGDFDPYELILNNSEYMTTPGIIEEIQRSCNGLMNSLERASRSQQEISKSKRIGKRRIRNQHKRSIAKLSGDISDSNLSRYNLLNILESRPLPTIHPSRQEEYEIIKEELKPYVKKIFDTIEKNGGSYADRELIVESIALTLSGVSNVVVTGDKNLLRTLATVGRHYCPNHLNDILLAPFYQKSNLRGSQKETVEDKFTKYFSLQYLMRNPAEHSMTFGHDFKLH